MQRTMYYWQLYSFTGSTLHTLPFLDVFSVAYQQTNDEKDLEYAFFGIFDGHGGREAAQYSKVCILRMYSLYVFFI